ncbi:hypothetical protein [Polluticoccus soli]|uniref:hypothetical protein n=1 Tax=Polluticoccus soli TaxID=3034150 RepID=UPI0023E23D56|nr:hypothetical protein [Flavipsychrobacter sp. JY13-12]
MITNQFITDILDLVLEEDSNGLALRKQIPYLIEDEHDYTGMGVFISFAHHEGIEPYRLGNETIELNEVDLKSSELASGGAAVVHVNEGLIDCIEIWANDGNYPDGELTDYTLSQQEGTRQIKKPA